MRIVNARETELAPAALARLLFDAFSAAAGRAPTRALVEIQAAQIMFETAGRPINGNLGNLSAAGFVNGEEVSHWDGLAWRPPWFEVDENSSPRMQDLHARMLAGTEPSAFRAYEPPEKGLGDYLSLFAHRYPDLLRAADAGEIDRYAELYQSTGYCRSCKPADVAAALRFRLDELRAAGAFDGLAFSAERAGQAGAEGPAILLAAVALAAAMTWLATRKI